MNLIVLLDSASVLFLAVAVAGLIRHRSRALERDALVILTTLLGVLAFRDISNLLEWSGHDVALDYLEDFVEVLCPLMWIFLAYGLLQQAARRELREEIRQRLVIEEQRRRLEASVHQTHRMESLGMLAGGIAHDFNNILLAVLGHADLALCDLPNGAPGRKDIEAIQVAALRAADLCRQMLTYSGKGSQPTLPTGLSELVVEMIEMLKASLPKDVQLVAQCPDDLPPIEADPSQIRQLVLNLIVNAAESCEGGHGNITVTTGHAKASAARDARQPTPTVFFEVTDTGCGLEPGIQERMYDPFYSTKFSGRGLGLSVVQGIARRHQAEIQVTSRLGQGTTFRILFPATGQPIDRSKDQQYKQSPQTWRGQGLVLLVDDEEPGREVARRMLERLGFDVVAAADGLEALAAYGLHQASIVCVLLDLTMPRMDGREALRELRKLDADLPVILMSGYDTHEASQRLAVKGATGFLQKPFQLAELRESLIQLLASRARAPEP